MGEGEESGDRERGSLKLNTPEKNVSAITRAFLQFIMLSVRLFHRVLKHVAAAVDSSVNHV